MSKEVTIKGAEVVTRYGTTDTYYEKKTEKSTIIKFQVKTKINDRAERSPHLYEKCYLWVNAKEQVDEIKNYLTAGNVLQITGIEDQEKYTDKATGKDQYKRTIKVLSITPIVINHDEASESEAIASDDDLPF